MKYYTFGEGDNVVGTSTNYLYGLSALFYKKELKYTNVTVCSNEYFNGEYNISMPVERMIYNHYKKMGLKKN